MFMPQPVLKTYYDALEESKILATKCVSCGTYEWPALPACNSCGSIDMEWTEIDGAAMLHECTPMTMAMQQTFNKFMPYYIGIGTLKENAPFTGMIFGINDANAGEVQKNLPVQIKAEIIQMDAGFKTVAWRLDDARIQ